MTDLQQKQIEVLKEILTHAYSKAAAYTNVIIITGYAAFFTLLNSLIGKLPAKPMFAAAVCNSFSVIGGLRTIGLGVFSLMTTRFSF